MAEDASLSFPLQCRRVNHYNRCYRLIDGGASQKVWGWFKFKSVSHFCKSSETWASEGICKNVNLSIPISRVTCPLFPSCGRPCLNPKVHVQYFKRLNTGTCFMLLTGNLFAGDFAPGDPMSNVSKVTSLPFGELTLFSVPSKTVTSLEHYSNYKPLSVLDFISFSPLFIF